MRKLAEYSLETQESLLQASLAFLFSQKNAKEEDKIPQAETSQMVLKPEREKYQRIFVVDSQVQGPSTAFKIQGPGGALSPPPWRSA